MMTKTIESIRAEYLRYKTLGEGAIRQLADSELSVSDGTGGNSIAVICWHISGNFRSRFTDFLTTDGEKPWRHRDEEFEARTISRAELLSKWEQGWDALLGALADLNDGQLEQTITIRGRPLSVNEALLRSLAHVAYHVGQIVYVAKSFRGSGWSSLSIPPGRSEEVNRRLSAQSPEPGRPAT